MRDPVVRELARRIELVPLADVGERHGQGLWPAEVVLECGGQRHTLATRPYKGSPANPFTWDDAVEKFRRYTRSLLPAGRATALIDAVGRLQDVSDVADVARLAAAA